jgi:CDP-diacylglycerol--glycerol-3-phosphate 3-phosphatidyltransferase
VTGSLVSPALRTRVRELATPIAVALGRLGLTPNALTVIGFLGTCAAAVAATQQEWLAAGVLVLVFGIFDLFDGTLARATGKVTTFGAFLDSTLDRAGEAIVYIGIIVGCLDRSAWQPALLASAAMAAAFLVSYVRAKAESLGFTPGTSMTNVGLAPREVRTVLVAIALLLTALNGGLGDGVSTLPLSGIDLPFGLFLVENHGEAYLTLTLGLITILATITVIQRILHVRAQAKEG